MNKLLTSVLFAQGILANDFISGEVKTNETFQYGKFITRMKAGNHNGTVASFFTYWNGPNWSDGQWNEIDVEIVPSEMIKHVEPFSTNIIYGSGTNYHKQEQAYEPISHDFNAYHVYEIEWTPDYISWTVDGKQVRKTMASNSEGVRFTNKQQHLMMNFWTPTFAGWGDGRDPSSMPWYVNYDYVETYHYSTSTKQFTFAWRDDFNSLDLKRWIVSDNWTFSDNSTKFMKSQVYTQNGDLVLKMQKVAKSSNEEQEFFISDNLVEEINEEMFLQA